MNQLLYNFLNEIDDVNKVSEMSVEQFIKLVRSNKLISEQDANALIESFKKLSTRKVEEDDDNDSDQRKKKYKQQHKNIDSQINPINTIKRDNKEKEDDSIER